MTSKRGWRPRILSVTAPIRFRRKLASMSETNIATQAGRSFSDWWQPQRARQEKSGGLLGLAMIASSSQPWISRDEMKSSPCSLSPAYRTSPVLAASPFARPARPSMSSSLTAWTSSLAGLSGRALPGLALVRAARGAGADVSGGVLGGVGGLSNGILVTISSPRLNRVPCSIGSRGRLCRTAQLSPLPKKRRHRGIYRRRIMPTCLQ